VREPKIIADLQLLSKPKNKKSPKSNILVRKTVQVES